MYNLTNVTAANDVLSIIDATDKMGGGYIIPGFLLMLFIAYLVVFKGNSFKAVWLSGSFFLTIITIFCFIIGWVNLTILITAIIMLFASIPIYMFVGD